MSSGSPTLSSHVKTSIVAKDFHFWNIFKSEFAPSAVFSKVISITLLPSEHFYLLRAEAFIKTCNAGIQHTAASDWGIQPTVTAGAVTSDHWPCFYNNEGEQSQSLLWFKMGVEGKNCWGYDNFDKCFTNMNLFQTSELNTSVDLQGIYSYFLSWSDI